MKKKILLSVVLLVLLLISTLCTIVTSSLTFIPKDLVINTGTDVIGIMYYDNFYIKANKITSNLGVGYCLEVEKEYPHGETFGLVSKNDKEVDKVLSVGYPNVSASELGVASDDDAYFATQVVIWSIYEDYDVNKIDIADKNVLQAVKNIYNNYKNNTSNIVLENAAEYYYNDKVQRIIVVIKNTVNVIQQSPENLEGEQVPRVIPEIQEDKVKALESDVYEIGNKSLDLQNEVNNKQEKALNNDTNEILGK